MSFKRIFGAEDLIAGLDYKSFSQPSVNVRQVFSRFQWSNLFARLSILPIIMSFFGKWKLTTQENFDEYMKAIGNHFWTVRIIQFLLWDYLIADARVKSRTTYYKLCNSL